MNCALIIMLCFHLEAWFRNGRNAGRAEEDVEVVFFLEVNSRYRSLLEGDGQAQVTSYAPLSIPSRPVTAQPVMRIRAARPGLRTLC